MSYTPRSLFRIVEDIDAHKLLLPHIQRAFVWEPEQMARLFDSLMRDYPIQTFLFWRTKEEIRARHFMPAVDPDADLSQFYDLAKSTSGVEKTFVLDGQQRLQTLHAIFRGAVVAEDGKCLKEAYCELTDGNAQVDNGDTLYRLVFSSEPLPLPWFRVRDLVERYGNGNASAIGDELNDAIEKVLPSELPDERKRRERQVRANVQQLSQILNQDKFFYIDELDGVATASAYPYRKILEIFIRVNSGGTKLTSGDLMFAAMKEGWDDIEQRVEQTVDLLNGGRLQIDSDFVLKCLLLVHNEGAEVQTEKFYGSKGEALLKRIESKWDQAERAFQQLRDFVVQTLRVESDRLVRSYNALIPLFDFLFHNKQPDEPTRILMAAYYNKAQLFGWYGRQTDAVLNAMHSIVANAVGGVFPLDEMKTYFRNRGSIVELQKWCLDDKNLRTIILNMVYCDQWGASPFNVAFKGNEPHVDHIYPQYMLRSKLGCGTSEINDIGNLRFVGATDNIRKRAELPDSYFARLKLGSIPIEKHLLVSRYADDPSELKFERPVFDAFRQARRAEIWRSAKTIVDPERRAETAHDNGGASREPITSATAEVDSV